MSSNDKTREKLMESMRMTKSDSGKKAEAVEAKSADKPKEAKPAAKKVAKPAAAKKAVKSTTASGDAYQSAQQRVWPD